MELDQSENDRTSWLCCCRSARAHSAEVGRLQTQVDQHCRGPESATSRLVEAQGEAKQAEVLIASSDGQLLTASGQHPDECLSGLAENTLADQVCRELAASQVEAMTISTGGGSSVGEVCSCSSETTPAEVASCADAKGDDLCQEEQESGDSSLRPTTPCEVFLCEMLTQMDFTLRQIRHIQQWLVCTVENACRWALRRHFKELSLVGSVALCVETPGSDVDVVCLTQSSDGKAPGLPGDCLRRIRNALKDILGKNPAGANYYSLQLIEDARVPILRALWGPPGYAIAVDILVDQRRPLDHVAWFQKVHATPRPSFETPPVMSLVTITLRCVKWWLRQRQLPPTKEGGLPTLVWLLLALRSLTLAGRGPESEEATKLTMPELWTHLADSLATFFFTYAAVGGLDGVLTFEEGSSASSFSQRSKNRRSPWAELSVLDPTLSRSENSEIAPRLLPATQLLIAYEFRRASSLLPAASSHDAELFGKDGHARMRQIFEQLPEGNNSLPASVEAPMGAIMLLGNPNKNVGTLELAFIDFVHKHHDWKAPFLHRSDTRSDVHVRILEVDEDTKECRVQKKQGSMVLCPCHFVCRVRVKIEKKKITIDDEGLQRYRGMRRYLEDLSNEDMAKVKE